MAQFLVRWAKAGQVKECMNLRLERWPSGNHIAVCTEEWASQVPAENTDTDVTGYHVPSGYTWPKCPENCPHFKKSDNFLLTASRDQHDKQQQQSKEVLTSRRLEGSQVKRVGSAVTFPETVTLEWLWKNVPAKLWGTALTMLIAALVAAVYFGIQLTKIKDVREYFGIEQKIEAPSISSVPAKTAPPSATTKK